MSALNPKLTEDRVGHLVAEEIPENDPLQAAGLSLDELAGATLRVPYFIGEAQFALIEQWFRRMTVPKTVLFVDHSGMVTLTDARWAGDAGGSRRTGTIRASTAIFGRPRQIRDEYKFREMTSTIDGIAEFADFETVKSDFTSWGSGGLATVTVKPEPGVSWRSQGFTYAIQASTPMSAVEGRSFSAESSAQISTSRSRGATANEHLVAQWPLRALLSLVHGTAVPWRTHQIKDRAFPTWMLAGPPRNPQPVDVRLSRTVRDAALPPGNHADFALPWADLRKLGARKLRRWTELYGDEVFRRGVEPAVEVLNGMSRFLEPKLLMTVIALDCMAYYRSPHRRNLNKSIENCLDAVGLSWPTIGSTRGIANALSTANNDLKHPDRLSQPDTPLLTCLTDLAMVIARAQIIDFLDLPTDLRTKYLDSREVHQAVKAFERNGIAFGEDGQVRPPVAE